MSGKRRIHLYAALLIALGFGGLAIVTLLLPVDARVAADLPTTALPSRIPLGIAFWVVLALAGSALISTRPTGAIVTFDLPFIAAATVLGGPVAGGWVAMIGSFELRELRGVTSRDGAPGSNGDRRIPWYGVLGNHALTTFPAVAAGLAVIAAGPLLDAAVGAGSAGGDLLRTVLVSAVFVVLCDALAFETLAIRSDRSFTDVLEDFGRDYWLMMTAETVVAWLMVVVFQAVGWWAPVVCVAALLAIWKGRPQDDRTEPLTGLFNEREFLRRTARLLERSHRRGRRVVVMRVELEDLDFLNRRLGRDGGDQVLRTVGDRLRTSLRPLDDAARLGGGVFAALLLLPDRDASLDPRGDPAEVIAWRLHQKVGGDVEIDNQPVEVRCSIGVAVEIAGAQRSNADMFLTTAAWATGQAQATGVSVVVRPVGERAHREVEAPVPAGRGWS